MAKNIIFVMIIYWLYFDIECTFIIEGVCDMDTGKVKFDHFCIFSRLFAQKGVPHKIHNFKIC